jgi:hypothetical protein
MVRIASSFFCWGSFALVSLIMLTVGLVGCGEPPECADVSCDFGVCEAGACVNPGSCETAFECVPGYTCGEEGVCKAQSACTGNADCASRSCQGGTCVNSSTCESNEECLERTYCATDGTCEPDPCNTFQCEDGQCLRGTTQCVSKDLCTQATESSDCIDGDKCIEGHCLSDQAFCDQIACERGECDFDTLSCVNAQSCSEDTECIDEYYCNDAGQCADDLCVVDNVDCTGNGVCVASLGECENADSCASNDDCLGGHWCVEGMCRLEGVACGDAGCPGTQTCIQDEGNLTAACEESDNCQTSLGCKDDRQCAGGVCLAPMSCEADRFEPNDSAENATDLFRYASALAVTSTVCSSDIDVFAVDTRAIPNVALRGSLVVTAEYAARDAGLGELELEVINPQGTSVDTQTSGPMGRDGIVEVRTTVNAATQGVYIVRVASVSPMNQAGVEYTLSADVQISEVADACESPTPLIADTPINAATDDGASYALGSACTQPHHPAQENVYQFEVTESSLVRIVATPGEANPDLDLTLGLRQSCTRLATEVDCADTSDGGGEVLSRVLAPGIYYVIVQVASGISGGDYRLTMSQESKMCSPADNRCSDADTSEACMGGDELVAKTCALGCNYRTGTCVTAQGDTCMQAFDRGGTDITETINWDAYTNQIEMPTSSCVPGGLDTQTRGPEVVYAVSLEAGYGLSAALEFPAGEHGSLYVLDGCFNPAAACVAGANDTSASVETLNYVNETSDKKVVYLVADSAGGGQSPAQLDVQIGEVICQPGTKMCDANGDVLECNGAGTAWQILIDCRDFGCVDGQCNPQCEAGEILGCSTTVSAALEYCDSSDRIAQFSCPGGGCTGNSCDNSTGDTCLDAIVVSDGTSHSDNFSSLSADYDPGSSSNCPSINGPDAAFRVTLQSGETVTATISSSGVDTSIAVVRDCSNVVSTCIDGTDDSFSSGSETVTYTASAAETVYVIAGAWYSSSTSGPFTVDFSITN